MHYFIVIKTIILFHEVIIQFFILLTNFLQNLIHQQLLKIIKHLNLFLEFIFLKKVSEDILEN